MDNAQGAGAPCIFTAAVCVFEEIIYRFANGLPADGAATVDEFRPYSDLEDVGGIACLEQLIMAARWRQAVTA